MYDDIMDRFGILPEHRADFVNMVNSGECSSEFKERLDADGDYQSAMDMAFAKRSEPLARFIRHIYGK